MQDTHEWAKRTFDSSDTRREAQYAAATEAANAALKALLILNGGACLALLAFLANVLDHEEVSRSAQFLVPAAISALVMFSWGAVCAVLTSGLAYLVNRFYAECLGARRRSVEHPFEHDTKASRRWLCAANGLNIAAILLFFASIGLFVAGIAQFEPWEVGGLSLMGA